MRDDLYNAVAEFVEDVVRIADKYEVSRDATLHRAVWLLQKFEATASIEEYEIEEVKQ